jgi:transposase-like protein
MRPTRLLVHLPHSHIDPNRLRAVVRENGIKDSKLIPASPDVDVDARFRCALCCSKLRIADRSTLSTRPSP